MRVALVASLVSPLRAAEANGPHAKNETVPVGNPPELSTVAVALIGSPTMTDIQESACIDI